MSNRYNLTEKTMSDGIFTYHDVYYEAKEPSMRTHLDIIKQNQDKLRVIPYAYLIASESDRIHYKVGEYTPLERIFRKRQINCNELTLLLNEIFHTLSNAKVCGLFENCFVLDPKYIYFKHGSVQPYLLYLPVVRDDMSLQDEFLVLLDFLEKVINPALDNSKKLIEMLKRTAQKNLDMTALINTVAKAANENTGNVLEFPLQPPDNNLPPNTDTMISSYSLPLPKFIFPLQNDDGEEAGNSSNGNSSDDSSDIAEPEEPAPAPAIEPPAIEWLPIPKYSPIEQGAIDQITDTDSAVSAVENALEHLRAINGGPIKEADMELLAIFSEKAIAQAAGMYIDATGGISQVTVNQANLEKLQYKAYYTHCTIEKRLLEISYALNRSITANVAFITKCADLTTLIEPSAMAVYADKVWIRTPHYDLSINRDFIQNNANTPLTIYTTSAVHSPRSYTITFSRPITEPIGFSVQPEEGDRALQILQREDGTIVPTNHNPVSGMLEARIQTNGTYRIVTAAKRAEDLDTAALTNKGIWETNQDKIFAKTGHINDMSCGLFCVADGISSLQEGEYAASIAIDAVDSWWNNELKQLSPSEGTRVLDELSKLLHSINSEIQNRAEAEKITLGTTCTLLLTWGSQYYIAHVGDSRIYQLEKKLFPKVKQLTEDHNWAAEQTKKAEKNADEIATHPKRNMLTGYLGIFEDLQIFTSKGRLTKHCSFLICSDGLYRAVEEKDLTAMLKTREKCNETAEKLMNQALKQMDNDNMSIVLVKVNGKV